MRLGRDGEKTASCAQGEWLLASTMIQLRHVCHASVGCTTLLDNLDQRVLEVNSWDEI